ncbi:hypothetical protein BCR44DRAFT_43252 [Catenaria anguillulae PL171]|uniref:Uncharacterized protein n=1 Tax=Catenaria anguillulae PL171 TaxID=765915 RepID=A0A1Y2HV83_9FUNG|nr:hypothetical protein BCR44DRAFT_43252 [Catenaria anguillulae PL171]
MQYVQLASFRDDSDSAVLSREDKIKLITDDLVTVRRARGPGAYSTTPKPAEGMSFSKSERSMSSVSDTSPAPNKYNTTFSSTSSSSHAFKHHCCYRPRVAMISAEEAKFARTASLPAPNSYSPTNDVLTSVGSPKALSFSRSTRWKVEDFSSANARSGPETYLPHLPAREASRAPLFDGYACRPSQNVISDDSSFPSPAHYNPGEAFHALTDRRARPVISTAARFADFNNNLGPGPAAELLNDLPRARIRHKARPCVHIPARSNNKAFAPECTPMSMINLRESETRRNVREHCIKL